MSLTMAFRSPPPGVRGGSVVSRAFRAAALLVPGAGLTALLPAVPAQALHGSAPQAQSDPPDRNCVTDGVGVGQRDRLKFIERTVNGSKSEPVRAV